MPGADPFNYVSSADGVSMTGILWLPPGFNVAGPQRPLFVFLHAAEGDASHMVDEVDGIIPVELDARGWIGVSLDGRAWDIPGCPNAHSSIYVDGFVPSLAWGEQDILDGIDWCLANLPVDTNRIYMTGHSMGAGGAAAIALKNPDRFAGVSVMGAVNDLYEFHARGLSVECTVPALGAAPNDNPVTDTLYSISSPRFLIENACNLPMFYGHGTADSLSHNIAGTNQYQHGWHMTSDATWSGCHTVDLCFGHTSTQVELAASHPDFYPWAYLFTDVHHVMDTSWYLGMPTDPFVYGTLHPDVPGTFIGMFDFLEGRRRPSSPATVVFKTYERKHQKAYWTSIEVTRPWQDIPGAIRAVRDTPSNSLSIELSRVATATIELAAAGVAVGPRGALTVNLARLVEPAFDVALDDSFEPLEPRLVLRGSFGSPSSIVVLHDGVPLAPGLLKIEPTQIEIGPLPITAPTVLHVFPRRLMGALGTGPIHW